MKLLLPRSRMTAVYVPRPPYVVTWFCQSLGLGKIKPRSRDEAYGVSARLVAVASQFHPGQSQ